MKRRLLLISNSTNYGEGYLDHAKIYIKSFLGDETRQVLLVPYASATMTYDEYFNKVNNVFSELQYEVKSLHDTKNKSSAVENAEAIVVGGGNTFHLTHMLHKNNIIKPIRKKVEKGTPYLGWSAGSIVACPTLMTTNDMPVIMPKSFETLNLIPFQINPHYTDTPIPNYKGETREERIKEFMALNTNYKVVGLKEGTMLLIENNKVTLQGNKTVKIFQYNKPTLEYDKAATLDFLLT